MSRALIIVAHGSSVNPSAAHTVIAAASALQQRPDIRARFEHVEARFLKQQPWLSEASWAADETVVVPFFMADGHFVQTVLPRYIPDDVLVTPPLGTADLTDVVRQIVASCDPTAHLVLVGHGTDRNPDSSASVEALALRLRPQLHVVVGFVDQDPRLDTVWERVPADDRPVVVLPYFAFSGPHTEHDIPQGLGITADDPQIDGHRVHYAAPIGTAPAVIEVLAALALG